MRSIFLSVVVITTLIAGGISGTFAGFVDTETSEANFYQAGISDLLVNGKNDPIGAKLQYTHGAPCKSVDFWVDLFNWGKCQGGMTYLRILNVVSEEKGTKTHVNPETGLDDEWVFDNVTVFGQGIPDGYRPAVGTEPAGPGVWSSEPEMISEVGGGYVAGIYIDPANPCLLGEDYASGVSEHLDMIVYICDDDDDGILDNADDNGDGEVDKDEEAAHTWIPVISGKLNTLDGRKVELGFLETQHMTFLHIDVHLQQIECPGWPDEQTKWWPTNALQGDKATWDMMFELIADP